MYCWNCGQPLYENAYVCPYCGALANPWQPPPKPKFYQAGFVLGILSLCIPFYGFILGIIGLPLACVSRRTSAIVLNSISVFVYVSLIVLAIVFGHTTATNNFDIY